MESTDWQTELSSIRERSQYAYEKNLFCDVKFTVRDSNGCKVTVPASKYVLAVSSPVFAAMFYGDIAEKRDTIDLPDCTKEGIEEMLHFVHSDEVNLTGSNVMEVLCIADKYSLPFLVEKCLKYCQDSLKPEEVFTVLLDDSLHVRLPERLHKRLHEHCWNFIDKETQRALSSEQFLDIPKEMLSEILTRDTLRIKEVEIFQAVERWASKRIEEECLEMNGKSKRAILGDDIIRLIRFPLMSEKQVSEEVLPSEILNKYEIAELFQVFTGNTPSTSIFSKEKRCVNQHTWTNNRFNHIKSPGIGKWNYEMDRFDAVDFTVSEALSLEGVRLFGSEGSEYDVEFELQKNDGIIAKISSTYVCDNEMIDDLYYAFTILLNEPVRLKPNVCYTLMANINSPLLSYYGEDGQAIVNVTDSLQITYKESSKSKNGTNDKIGQFPSLLFIL